jgi:hypothetical protein
MPLPLQQLAASTSISFLAGRPDSWLLPEGTLDSPLKYLL